MKKAVYRLKSTLGDSWGLTLIVLSVALYLFSGVLGGIPNGLGPPASSYEETWFFYALGLIGGLIQALCVISQIVGLVLTISEKVHLKHQWHQMHLERAEAAHNAGQHYEMPQKRSTGRFLKDNIGLTLAAGATLLSGLGAGLTISVLIFALSTDDILTGISSSSMSDLGEFGLITLALIGVIMILIGGVVFPVGVIIAIFQEIKKRRWMTEVLDAHRQQQALQSSAGSGSMKSEGHDSVDHSDPRVDPEDPAPDSTTT